VWDTKLVTVKPETQIFWSIKIFTFLFCRKKSRKSESETKFKRSGFCAKITTCSKIPFHRILVLFWRYATVLQFNAGIKIPWYINKTVNARITWHWVAFVQPLLQWESNKYYIFWVYICSLRYQVCKRMPLIVVCDVLRSTVFFHTL